MIKKLCVIGAGTMGAGIAQVAIEKGVEVAMRDVDDRFVEKGLAMIRNFLGRKLEKGKLSAAEHDAILFDGKEMINLPAHEVAQRGLIYVRKEKDLLGNDCPGKPGSRRLSGQG